MSTLIDPSIKCSQCGCAPADHHDDAQPEILVLAENFGEPYLFGVRCGICGRVARAVGRDAAITRYNEGGHDLNMDEFGYEDEEEEEDED